jgi:hypothetical protein
MVDDAVVWGSTREQARQIVDDWVDRLGDKRGAAEARVGVPDRSTWGLLPEHQEATQRAVSLFGPPVA